MSNKPNWENAPKWAHWLAMDKGGRWYWYLHMPSRTRMEDWLSSGVCGIGSGLYELAGVEKNPKNDWSKSLEQHP